MPGSGDCLRYETVVCIVEIWKYRGLVLTTFKVYLSGHYKLKLAWRCSSLGEHRCAHIVRSCLWIPALKIKDNQS